MSRYIKLYGTRYVNKYIVTLHVKSLICILHQMIECHDQLSKSISTTQYLVHTPKYKMFI